MGGQLPGGVGEFNRFSGSAVRRLSPAAQVMRIGHEEQVLVAGEHGVHRAELVGAPDRRPVPPRGARRVVAVDVDSLLVVAVRLAYAPRGDRGARCRRHAPARSGAWTHDGCTTVSAGPGSVGSLVIP
ncbi:hypothetical protein STRIP9103_06657 [Streptomyces ipomoeae 91-03]|uniref:Uncharacterized protein n=1 Tax=Streptomyces ipomoeae 91-03 TaxID=698759 RepID=L1L3N4_9ACTN|nr:hypothetical protein STRIP9103_06657 [Streptomyces ipomoeae 91-03]